MTRRGRHARRGLAAAGTCLRSVNARSMARTSLATSGALKLPVMPFLHGVGFERRELHPPHFFDAVAHRQQIPAQQFAASRRRVALRTRDLEDFFLPHACARSGNILPRRVCARVFICVVAQAALHFDPVRLRQGRRRFQHAAGEFAVVGQKYGAAGGVIEAAHGKDALGNSDQKIAQRAAAFGVSQRGNHFGAACSAADRRASSEV